MRRSTISGSDLLSMSELLPGLLLTVIPTLNPDVISIISIVPIHFQRSQKRNKLVYKLLWNWCLFVIKPIRNMSKNRLKKGPKITFLPVYRKSASSVVFGLRGFCKQHWPVQEHMNQSRYRGKCVSWAIILSYLHYTEHYFHDYS